MGNQDSKHGHHRPASSDTPASSGRRSGSSSELETAYKIWCERFGGISKEALERVFGPVLGQKLWRHLKGPENCEKISLDVLEGRLTPLIFGCTNDIYLRIIAEDDGSFKAADISDLVHVCRACSGVQFNASADQKSVDSVIAATIAGRDNVELDEVKNWIEVTCPRLLSSLKRTVANGLQTATTHCDKWVGPKSRLLSPLKVWLIQCCVPSYFIKPEAASPADYLSDSVSSPICAVWDLLYSSEDDGLSPNRFENKVFNYRSPTVLVVETFGNELFCVCSDEEWKLSTQRYGKSGCAVYRLYPKLELLESGGVSGMIFFNTKQRGLPQGLFVGSNPKSPQFSINADFSNVRSVEVWGCGSPESYLAQQNQRQWEKRQIEKQQKVPLPGNWEDSPDRMLLEFAGVKTQHAEN